MILGIPIVGMATTELSAVIKNGHSGYIHTDINYLIDRMKALLDDMHLARQIGKEGQGIAQQRFNIRRFIREWEALFSSVIQKNGSSRNIETIVSSAF